MCTDLFIQLLHLLVSYLVVVEHTHIMAERQIQTSTWCNHGGVVVQSISSANNTLLMYIILQSDYLESHRCGRFTQDQV